MKKLGILIVVVILCAAGWAGATYVVGGKVENRYFGLLEQYGRYGPMTLSSRNYERGLFASRAATLLEITLPQPDREPGREPDLQTVQLLFEHDLHHGPLLFGAGPTAQGRPSAGLALIETRLESLSFTDAEIASLFEAIPELRDAFATVAIDFDGSSETLVRVPPFERRKDDARITWGGFAFTMDYAPAAGEVSGEMEIPSLAVRSADADITCRGIRSRFDMVEVLPALYVGTSQGVFDGMDVELSGMGGEGRHVLQMKQAEFASDSSFEAGLVDVRQFMNFEGLTVEGDHYGPLILDVDLRNLDGQALSEMQQQTRQVYLQVGTINPDEIAAELIPVYTRYLKRLMAGNPELEIKRLHLTTPEGEADGSFRAKLTSSPEVPLDNAAALFSALQYLDAALDVALDERLVRALLANKMDAGLRDANSGSPRDLFSEEERAAMVEGQVGSQLEMWAAQNFIVREGGKVKARATFREGTLMVNGKPLPLFGG